MKISTKVHLATTTALAAILLIAGMVWWTHLQAQDAADKRRQTTEISRGLAELRLLTIEYIVHSQEKARDQEQAASRRVDQLMEKNTVYDPEQVAILTALRARNAEAHQLFRELVAARTWEESAGNPTPEALARLDSRPTTGRLLAIQQENLADTIRLSNLTTNRIDSTQNRVALVTVAGLALIGLVVAGAAWFINRDVLRPIGRLQGAMGEVAAGNWGYELDTRGDDELAAMARSFSSMTQSLRHSFEQIERSNVELAALNKEIEAFSYSVSHDLRGPLRSMDGFSLALLEDYGDKLDDEAKDYLNRIRAASQRMGRLIDELLGLSKVTRTELAVKPVDLSAIARDIAQGISQQNPGRKVEWAIEDGVEVLADKSLMQIAMQNLLENAFKFSGKVDDPVIQVGTLEREGKRTCFVRDNGVGFDMAYADRLFGAFQRLHHESDFSGTGIGLAIVHRIFRRHEGKVWAESRPGQGATFFFQLKEQPHD